MTRNIEEIEIKEEQTLSGLLEELQLTSTPVLVEVNGEVFYPDEAGDKRLKRGDKVAVIRLIAGG